MANTKHLILLVLPVVVLGAQKVPPQKCRMTNLACNHDKALVIDPVCRFKVTRTLFAIYNIGLTFLRPVDKIVIGLESFHKNSANRWQTGFVHIKTDICSLFGEKKEIFVDLITKLFGKIPDIVHACPYEGRIELTNYTVQSVDHILKYFPGLPSGEYKYVATLYQGANSSKFFELSSSVYCKMDTLNPTWM